MECDGERRAKSGRLEVEATLEAASQVLIEHRHFSNCSVASNTLFQSDSNTLSNPITTGQQMGMFGSLDRICVCFASLVLRTSLVALAFYS